MSKIFKCENFECWFMKEGFTFIKCSGSLSEIRGRLKELLSTYDYSGWGNLRMHGSNEKDCLILGIEYDLKKLDDLIKQQTV